MTISSEEAQAAWETWVRQAAAQGDLTRAAWEALVNRLDGSEGDAKDVIRSFADNELLLLWNASRGYVEDNGSENEVAEMYEFIRKLMVTRAYLWWSREKALQGGRFFRNGGA